MALLAPNRGHRRRLSVQEEDMSEDLGVDYIIENHDSKDGRSQPDESTKLIAQGISQSCDLRPDDVFSEQDFPISDQIREVDEWISKPRRSFHLMTSIPIAEHILLLIACLCSFICGAIPLAFYYFFGAVLNATRQELSAVVQRTSYIFFGLAAVAGFTYFMQWMIFTFVGEKTASRIRVVLFKAITRQDIAFFDDRMSGNLASRLTEDTNQLKVIFSERLGLCCMGIVQFFGGIVIALYFSWKMSLMMMATAPLMGIAIYIQGRLTVYFSTKSSMASARAQACSEEVIGSFRTVRAFSNENKELIRYAKLVSALDLISSRKSMFMGLSLGFTQSAIWASSAVSFFYGGYLIGEEELNIGKLVTVFGMLLFSSVGISQVFSIFPELAKARSSYVLIREIINRKTGINFQGGHQLKTLNGSLEFKGVTFQYPTAPVPILRNISFKIEPGQTVAFVGESGSGKSTIFSLIERFYDPTNGAILVDQVKMREFDPQWWRKQVALVSQDPVLVATNILENISYAKEDATEEEIQTAATIANAHGYICTLPDRYNTEVGERGIQLSSGQKQRIAIARAVILNPKFLLLDEPTSALDSDSERQVQEALDHIMPGRTCLVIAHRLATVKKVDKIIVLQYGRIVGEGTHKELMETNDIYRQLAQRQFAPQDLL